MHVRTVESICTPCLFKEILKKYIFALCSIFSAAFLGLMSRFIMLHFSCVHSAIQPIFEDFILAIFGII